MILHGNYLMTCVKLADYLTPCGGFIVCLVRYAPRPKSDRFTSAKTAENKRKAFDLLSRLSSDTTWQIWEFTERKYQKGGQILQKINRTDIKAHTWTSPPAHSLFPHTKTRHRRKSNSHLMARLHKTCLYFLLLLPGLTLNALYCCFSSSEMSLLTLITAPFELIEGLLIYVCFHGTLQKQLPQLHQLFPTWSPLKTTFRSGRWWGTHRQSEKQRELKGALVNQFHLLQWKHEPQTAVYKCILCRTHGTVYKTLSYNFILWVFICS